MHNAKSVNPEFLHSIRESKERLRLIYEEVTGETELEKGLIQILKCLIKQDEVA